MTTEPFQLPVRVYYEDTDAQGVVYYANYFRFMERARTEWLEAMGVDHITMMNEDNRILVVSEAHAKFLIPARLGDSLIVTASLSRLALTTWPKPPKRAISALASGLTSPRGAARNNKSSSSS